jgi:uncharacterized membrane protein YsdA (DUF1294 family)
MPHRRAPKQAKKPTFLYHPSGSTILTFAVLLTPPLVGLIPSHPILTAYVLAINFLTYLLYRHDKAQSRIAGWRITEQRLHLCELLGGWPAAFIAQRNLQHKTRKTSYQIEFWAIVVVHEALWIDWLTGGFLRRLVRG